MSTARRTIDSTFRRLLNYTAEIIMSIILLVMICIPLSITIPMWLQHVLLGTPRSELTINLVAWFGYDGALWVTLLLGLVSFSLSYIYILKMKPGITSTTDEKEVDEEVEYSDKEEVAFEDEDVEEEEEIAAEDQEEEEIAAEDQEEDEEHIDLDEIETSLEDMEEEEEEEDV
ncbi:MAG: hypothetical protein BV458_11165 [Thermoplasmata archaeon M9B2D]|nr:MAG: hypothetical protein BV458_11165 [Thermoplasmata archaeon M9B2D]